MYTMPQQGTSPQIYTVLNLRMNLFKLGQSQPTAGKA